MCLSNGSACSRILPMSAMLSRWLSTRHRPHTNRWTPRLDWPDRRGTGWLSIGLEDADDLIADLDQALHAALRATQIKAAE